MASPRVRTLLLIACGPLFAGLPGTATPAAAQSLSPLTWQTDEIGYAYYETVRNGMRQRVYQRPDQQAFAWEVRNHIGKLGLPDARPPAATIGRDALGRNWRSDELGYPYYEVARGPVSHRVYYQPERRAAAAQARFYLQQVDWEAAARQGVRNAVVRGFNAARTPALPAPGAIRSAVSDALVDGLNRVDVANLSRPRAGDQPLGPSVATFQRLVEAGVEDAVVQALNQVQTQAAASEPPPAGERTVLHGWVQSDEGLFPLLAGPAYQLRPLADVPLIAVYSEGRLLYARCRYFALYEDALETQRE
ncbi:hypothetical protein [Lignipirellula cremea]|uniref:Uncharacterized protein n=1 Tax=Lignipirellula cremea TaxID=2528010 RepID=A0A518DN34_9BACT|nr:hypothetical protein [Lignipirellula cremea]QDU93231.1 hypothetical protein Pla8534_10100 [Lignipirellula cremea]